jgi:hypothetical protein
VSSRHPAAAGLRAALFLLIVLIPASCSSDPTRGYSFRPAYDTSVRTISVPIFDNPTFSHGVEVQLTDAIIKEIQRRTPWVVVTAGAQSTLRGRVTNVQMRPLTTSRLTGLVEEVAVSMTVDFTWEDSRTGRPILSRQSFSAARDFVPARPTGERLELGEHAVVQELARAIVNEMRSQW